MVKRSVRFSRLLDTSVERTLSSVLDFHDLGVIAGADRLYYPSEHAENDIERADARRQEVVTRLANVRDLIGAFNVDAARRVIGADDLRFRMVSLLGVPGIIVYHRDKQETKTPIYRPRNFSDGKFISDLMQNGWEFTRSDGNSVDELAEGEFEFHQRKVIRTGQDNNPLTDFRNLKGVLELDFSAYFNLWRDINGGMGGAVPVPKKLKFQYVLYDKQLGSVRDQEEVQSAVFYVKFSQDVKERKVYGVHDVDLALEKRTDECCYAKRTPHNRHFIRLNGLAVCESVIPEAAGVFKDKEVLYVDSTKFTGVDRRLGLDEVHAMALIPEYTPKNHYLDVVSTLERLKVLLAQESPSPANFRNFGLFMFKDAR